MSPVLEKNEDKSDEWVVESSFPFCPKFLVETYDEPPLCSFSPFIVFGLFFFFFLMWTSLS